MHVSEKQSPWISRAEACRMLGVSSATVGKMADERRIGTLLVPGLATRSYSRADVERLVQAGTTLALIGHESRSRVESSVN